MLLLVLACSSGSDLDFSSFVEERTQDQLGSYALVANGTAEAHALGVTESLSVASADPEIVSATIDVVEGGANLHLATGAAGGTEVSLIDDGDRVLDTVSLSVEDAIDADVVPTAVNLLPELAEVPTQVVVGGDVLLDAHLYGASGMLGGVPGDRPCDEPTTVDGEEWCADTVVQSGGLLGVQASVLGDVDLGEWLGSAFDGRTIVVVAADAVQGLESRMDVTEDGQGRVLAVARDAAGLPILGTKPTWQSESGAFPEGAGDLYLYDDDPGAAVTRYTATFGEESATFEVRERAIGKVVDSSVGCSAAPGRGLGMLGILAFVAVFIRRDGKYPDR
jgi:hypothetical protein